jgi:hypothetical protein
MSHAGHSSSAAGGPIEVHVHPPERGRGTPVILPTGCCCCCCCCLHTIGGLIGGLVGTTQTIDPPPRPVDPNFPFPFRRDELEQAGPLLPLALLYWLLVCFGIGLTMLWVLLFERARPEEAFLTGGFIAIMILPGIQLGASLLALFAVLLFYADQTAALMRLGRISLWSLVGTLIGGGLMGMGCILMGGFRGF